MNTTAPRPTENTAVRGAKSRPLAAVGQLQELLAYAIRVHDSFGANLLRHAVARALAGGQVGA